jgi:hypothetical protein
MGVGQGGQHQEHWFLQQATHTQQYNDKQNIDQEKAFIMQVNIEYWIAKETH